MGEISDGVTAQTVRTRGKYCSNWGNYCTQCRTDPYIKLFNPCEQARILAELAARLLTGSYGHRYQVHVQSVTDSLADISKTCYQFMKQIIIYQIEG